MSEPDRPGSQPPVGRSERLLTDDQLPASVGQLKSLRRWLIVAGVWAVAATALAVFALIQANQEDEEGREQAAGELGRVQRDLDNRINGLEQEIEGLPSSEDVSNLENRLGQVEDDASQAAQSAERLGNRVDDLEGRVDQLEQDVEGLSDQGTGTETTP
jgi:septal ring factor EnvC (AmiA/AmiB activator)